jgi:hypothetical protein
MRQCLKEGLNAEERNLTFLEDSAAIKEAIHQRHLFPSDKANRSDGVFFFFSGYAGKSGDKEIACPVEVSQ